MPDGSHGIETYGHYSTAVELRARRVLDLLPGATVERTRDVIQINYGGQAGIVVLVTPEALELRLPTVDWTQGAWGPEESSRLWRRIAWTAIEDEDDDALQPLLESAQAARRRQFRTCRYCGGDFPPERRSDKDVCHGCASRFLGVVF